MTKNKDREQDNRKSKKNFDESLPIETNRFVEYKGTAKLKKNVEKETLTNVSKENRVEHQQTSIIAQMPIKKRLSVQFYPVEHVQFISTRLEKK